MAKDKDEKAQPSIPTDTAVLAALVRIESKVDAALTRLAAIQAAQPALVTKIDDTQALVLQITRSLP